MDLYEADAATRSVREVARSDGRVLSWIIGQDHRLAGRKRQLGDSDGSDVAFEVPQADGSWRAVEDFITPGPAPTVATRAQALVGCNGRGFRGTPAVAEHRAPAPAAVFALFAVVLRADQIITGTAITLAAVGLTGTIYRQAYGSGGAALVVIAPGSGPKTVAPSRSARANA